MWERENEEEHRLHGMQNKCMNAALASFLYFDVRYRFSIREGRTQDDSTHNIITGHCGVFLLFPSLFFPPSRWPRSSIPGQKIWPAILLPSTTLKSTCSSSSFASFFPHGRRYNETGLLVILPATLSVCLGALGMPRSNLLRFNHPSSFFALSRQGELVLLD